MTYSPSAVVGEFGPITTRQRWFGMAERFHPARPALQPGDFIAQRRHHSLQLRRPIAMTYVKSRRRFRQSPDEHPPQRVDRAP
jgi:hypothetical protein